MSRLETNGVAKANVQAILKELVQWQDELDRDIVDSIIYETLDTVIDIIIDNCEEI